MCPEMQKMQLTGQDAQNKRKMGLARGPGSAEACPVLTLPSLICINLQTFKVFLLKINQSKLGFCFSKHDEKYKTNKTAASGIGQRCHKCDAFSIIISISVDTYTLCSKRRNVIKCDINFSSLQHKVFIYLLIICEFRNIDSCLVNHKSLYIK